MSKSVKSVGALTGILDRPNSPASLRSVTHSTEPEVKAENHSDKELPEADGAESKSKLPMEYKQEEGQQETVYHPEFSPTAPETAEPGRIEINTVLPETTPPEEGEDTDAGTQETELQAIVKSARKRVNTGTDSEATTKLKPQKMLRCESATKHPAKPESSPQPPLQKYSAPRPQGRPSLTKPSPSTNTSTRDLPTKASPSIPTPSESAVKRENKQLKEQVRTARDQIRTQSNDMKAFKADRKAEKRRLSDEIKELERENEMLRGTTFKGIIKKFEEGLVKGEMQGVKQEVKSEMKRESEDQE